MKWQCSDAVPLVVIWTLVMTAAVVVGVLTGDGGGAGKLAAVVGLALTAAYRWLRPAGRSSKESRRTRSTQRGGACVSTSSEGSGTIGVVAVLLAGFRPFNAVTAGVLLGVGFIGLHRLVERRLRH